MISVLLPFRNAEKTLEEALTSTLDDLGPHDELIAVDDGSRDGGPAIVAAHAARDPRIVTRTTEGTAMRGAGIVEALRTALAAARGRFIARMDGDDVTLPGRFAEQRAMLASDPSLGAVAVQVEAFPEPREGMQRYVSWQNDVLTPVDHARAIFVEAPLCHPATMLRRDALEAVGGWRDEVWAEDYDLWLRLDAAGFGLAKVPRVLFRWRMRPDSLTWTDHRYSADRLREARALYLGRRLNTLGRPFAVWGAGTTGKRLARALEAHGCRPDFFVDIDPAKIGRTARGLPIVAAEDALARPREGLLLVVAVGARGARDEVRRRLTAASFLEGSDFVCAA